MTHSNQDATAVASKYKDVSLQFKRHFRDAYERLQDRIAPLKQNERLAESLRQHGRRSIADQISKCGCQMIGNNPNELRPSYYCKQMFWCRSCMFQLAVNRREQWIAANEQFAKIINCEELILNRLLVRPRTTGLTDRPEDDLYLATKLILEFKRQLSLYHRSYNVNQFLDGKLGGKTALKQKERLLGPTRTAIHIVPPSVQKYSHQRAFIHLHVTIVTPRQMRAKKLTANMLNLWNKAKQIVGVDYVPSDSEITRVSIDDKWQDPFDRPYRTNHFPVFQKDHSATISTSKHLAYLSLPFKTTWEPEGLIEAHNIMQSLGLKNRRLNQSLGMMGALRKQLPCEFNPERLRHKFIADFTGDEWTMRMRNATKQINT